MTTESKPMSKQEAAACLCTMADGLESLRDDLDGLDGDDLDTEQVGSLLSLLRTMADTLPRAIEAMRGDDAG